MAFGQELTSASHVYVQLNGCQQPYRVYVPSIALLSIMARKLEKQGGNQATLNGACLSLADPACSRWIQRGRQCPLWSRPLGVLATLSLVRVRPGEQDRTGS
jgi:hypothetical protein